MHQSSHDQPMFLGLCPLVSKVKGAKPNSIYLLPPYKREWHHKWRSPGVTPLNCMCKGGGDMSFMTMFFFGLGLFVSLLMLLLLFWLRSPLSGPKNHVLTIKGCSGSPMGTVALVWSFGESTVALSKPQNMRMPPVFPKPSIHKATLKIKQQLSLSLSLSLSLPLPPHGDYDNLDKMCQPAMSNQHCKYQNSSISIE